MGRNEKRQGETWVNEDENVWWHEEKTAKTIQREKKEKKSN